ncbi:hypothetical protein [Aquimarina sp. 2201CG5-10]|uniref:hypothetical protein n=1 Tax=Aquimarina callyspongiae TaxID=3098150 RepID=UPI002AB4CC58|nr:hypothetical protein [Aquimarina sp. 2201CG5-10]MDY8134107.1 hypothetical protein [Aquimarina sp. 2201CG5-10]
MRKTNKTKVHPDIDEIQDVYALIEKNMDCTKKVILHIDFLIERTDLPETTIKSLTSLRNICAVNVMNLARAIAA